MVIVSPLTWGYSPSKWPKFMAYKWGVTNYLESQGKPYFQGSLVAGFRVFQLPRKNRTQKAFQLLTSPGMILQVGGYLGRGGWWRPTRPPDHQGKVWAVSWPWNPSPWCEWEIIRSNLDVRSSLKMMAFCCIWMFPKIVGFPPKSSILIGVFHCKPSILGYHYFWKHLYGLSKTNWLFRKYWGDDLKTVGLNTKMMVWWWLG